jgi:hypothetical protein
MKNITIGFSRPKNKIFPFFSWFIRLFQGWSDYSHVFLKINSKSIEREIIYQASGLQVNFVGNDYFKTHIHNIKEFNFKITNKDYKKLLQFMVDNSGKPYSIFQIIGILFYKINPKLIKIFINNDKKYICSELIGKIINDYIGIKINNNLDFLTPKNLWDLLNK